MTQVPEISVVKPINPDSTPADLTVPKDSNSKPSSEDVLRALSRAIDSDYSSDEYDFHLKLLKEAQFFIERKLVAMGFNSSMRIYPNDTKRRYLENLLNEDPYARIWLDISRSWYQKKIPKKIMENLVSSLNKEFNLERRYGLFFLDYSEHSKDYLLYFNPNNLDEDKFNYTKSGRLVSRSILNEEAHLFDRLDEDEIFALHMEDSLMEKVIAKYPNSKKDSIFVSTRNNKTQGLQTWIDHPVVRQNLIKEINDWNLEYNVEKRSGVFRYKSFGSYFHLWFEPSRGNQGYKALKQELLTERAIGLVENKYGVTLEKQ